MATRLILLHVVVVGVVASALTACASGDDRVVIAVDAATSPTTAPAAVGTTVTVTPSSRVATTTPTTTSTSTTSTSTTSTSTTSTSTTSTTTTSTTTTTLPPPPSTSCERVAHVGDSTGVWLWEDRYVAGGAANVMGERYRAVGVDDVVADNNGGRAIVERIADWQTTALEVVTSIQASGFDGCWVIMIGTNDAANIAAGARIGAEERILRMLYAIGDQPVLWVDSITQGVSSAYRNSSMQAWNEVLYRIADERENVVVLRWSERVRPEWFQSDGIHYSQEGRAWRAAITALALTEAFPG